MKSDVIQYERIYHLMKSKIACGIFPVGAKLPGRSILCKEFGTSERTIRRAEELLEQDGFLEITPRKRPTVISAFAEKNDQMFKNMKKADAAQVNDLLQSAILLCYPIYLQGMRLCADDEWRIPELLFRQMDPKHPKEFWQLANRLWRFFIARNENALLLRAVDSLGFRGAEPSLDSLEDRVQYCSIVNSLFQTIKSGKEPEKAALEHIFAQYRIIAEQAKTKQFLQMRPLCPMLAEADRLDQQLSLAQERYSTVCLDLLGLIAIGRYQPGDRLPTHDKLQEYYGVSRDTTVKAIRMLQNWGVVTAAPRRGIFVAMNLEQIEKIHISPESIACHVRRYLDSLELLSLTVEQVAAHAAAYASPKKVQQLHKDILRQWEHPYAHQLIPRTLLDFITIHIQFDALRSIYEVLARNLSIGRSIPKLISPHKNVQNCGIYRKCIASVEILLDGDIDLFAKAVTEIFEQIRCLIVEECGRLGYWEAAMQVYNGTSLWK